MRYIQGLIVLGITLFLSGCLGSSDDDSGPVVLQCGDPQWQVNSRTPFDTYTISGIEADAAAALADESQSAYVLAVNADAEDASGSGIIIPLKSIDADNGTVTSYVPMTHKTAFTGATMDLELIAGDATCDGPAVEVDAIAESSDPDGTLSALGDDYGQLLLEKAALYGYNTLDELRTARDEFLDGLWTPSTGELPLLLALDSYDAVKNQWTQLPDEERTLLASVLEHLDYPTGVANRSIALTDFNNVEGLSSQTSLPAFQFEAATTQSQGYQRQPLRTLAQDAGTGGTVTATNSACGAIVGESVSVVSASQLSYFMRRQNELSESLSGLSGATRDALMVATPAIGVASGGAAAAIGGLLYVEKTLTELEVATLPSEFKSLTYQLTPGKRIPEDYEAAGKQAEWNNAKVAAGSEGFNLTGPALDALSQVIGVGRWASGIGKQQDLLGKIDSLQGDLIQNEVFDALKNITDDAECLQIPAQTWSDIDVTDRQWTVANITQGQSLTLADAGDNDRLLNLQELGVSGLEVEIKPDPFGGETIRQPTFLEVVQFDLIPQPSYLRVTETLPASKTLTVAISDSEAPDEPLTATNQSGVGSIDTQPVWQDITTGHTFDVTTPAASDDFPMVVQVSRVSPLTGDTRTANITLSTEADITLTPQSACLENGETTTFTATVEGADASTALNWTADAGQINPQGFSAPTEEAIYSSPTGQGSATVEVSLASDSSVSDSASVTYGDCDSELAMYGNYRAEARDPENSNDPVDQLTAGTQLPSEPTVPDSFWLNRTEQTASVLTVNPARLDSSILYQSSTDGTASYELDMSTGSTDCYNDGNGNILCGTVKADASWSAKYYIEISAPVTYQFNFEMQCSQTGKGWAQAWMIPTIFRYVGGEDGDGTAIPPNGYPGGPVEPSSGNFINTNIDDAMPSSTTTDPTVTEPINVCKDTLDTVTVSKTMEFEGPATAGDPDLIILSIMLEEGMVGIDNYDVDSTLKEGATGPIRPSGDPPVGTNDGTASINIQMSMKEQSP